jgi:dienelactone hydrolase
MTPGTFARESVLPLRLGAALSLIGAVLLTLVAFTRERNVEADTPWTEPVPAGFTTLGARAPGDAQRFIPVAAWYPAASGKAPRLRLGDYIALAAAGMKVRQPVAREALGDKLAAAGAPREEVERWMNALLGAHREAPALQGRVPLVLIAAGHDESASDQAVLAEHLASHGYVVAAAPFPTLLGTPAMASEDDIGRVAEVQADDLAAIIAAMSTWETIDTTRMAVIGHSFGARAGLLLAMRDRRVRALVSLDGGIGSSTGAASMARAPSFDAKRRTAPILHVYGTLDEWMRPDRALLRGLDSTDVWLAATQAMRHHHFTTYGAVAAGYAEVQRALGHMAGTAREYAAVNALVLRFLDANLREGPFDAGVTAGGLAVERLALNQGARR